MKAIAAGEGKSFSAWARDLAAEELTRIKLAALAA